MTEPKIEVISGQLSYSKFTNDVFEQLDLSIELIQEKMDWLISQVKKLKEVEDLWTFVEGKPKLKETDKFHTGVKIILSNTADSSE